jgi:hypothetical protein
VRLTRADRHRLVFASVLTAVAFPAVLWENERGDAVNRSNIAAVGVPAAGAVDAVAASTSIALPEPAYLAPAEGLPVAASAPTVMVGGDSLVARAEATYRRAVDRADHCWYDGVAEGAVVTIVNTANGRTRACVVVGRPAELPGTVVLSPAGFAELADYSDAPIHVDVRR